MFTEGSLLLLLAAEHLRRPNHMKAITSQYFNAT
jgi:hypothetical protein